MQLARLLLEDGKHRQAHQVAEGFDGNATAYLVDVPESLEIRIRAAQALGRTDDVAQYRERLRKIRGGGR
jgi:Tfp pilus assembly protein PilF